MQGTKVIHIFVPFKRKGTMKVDNVKSQMRKGMLEYCIMLLLHKEPAYASEVKRSSTDCGGRYLVSIADAFKK
jgi:PadR family transcriptional regulator PadR